MLSSLPRFNFFNEVGGWNRSPLLNILLPMYYFINNIQPVHQFIDVNY